MPKKEYCPLYTFLTFLLLIYRLMISWTALYLNSYALNLPKDFCPKCKLDELIVPHFMLSFLKIATAEAIKVQ